MTSDTDDLAAIFVDVSGTGTVTERQVETPSHAPIEDDAELPDLTEDGLEDAVGTSIEHDGGG